MAGVLGADPVEAFGKMKSDAARWRLLKDLFDKAGNTSYARHYMVMYHELFGLKGEPNDRNWKTLHEAIRRKTGQKGWYAEVTKKRCKLVTAVRNVTPFDERWDPEYFTPILRMERVLRLHIDDPGNGLAEFEKGAGCTIGSVRSLKTAIRKVMEEYRRKGAVGVKFGHAYWRTLYHEDVSDADANRALAKILKSRKLKDIEVKALQDWGFRHVVRTAGEMNLVVQIHTGGGPMPRRAERPGNPQ